MLTITKYIFGRSEEGSFDVVFVFVVVVVIGDAAAMLMVSELWCCSENQKYYCMFELMGGGRWEFS